MTIEELKTKYSEEELSNFPGDKKLRYEMFAPLFNNLYEQKVIYCEKVLGIVRLDEITITPDLFKATAVPDRCVVRNNDLDDIFMELPKWTFSANWDWMRLIDESINVPYANWTIWTDPKLVKVVEKLCHDKDYDEALGYFFY